MKKSKIFGYFKSELGIIRSNKNWYRFTDPTDSENTLAVNFEYGVVKDFKNSINTPILKYIQKHKSLPTLIDVYDRIDQYESNYEPSIYSSPSTSSVDLPEYYLNLCEGSGVLANRIRQYVTQRGFDIEELDYRGFGYCMKGSWIGYLIIPIIVGGKLRGYIGRDILETEGRKRYKNQTGFEIADWFYNEDYLRSSRIGLTEGWADADTIGVGGVASLGFSLSPNQLMKLKESPASEIYYFADQGFEKKGASLLYPLTDYKKIYIVEIGRYGKDVNQLHDRLDLLEKAIKEAIELTLEYCVE